MFAKKLENKSDALTGEQGKGHTDYIVVTMNSARRDGILQRLADTKNV
jgi:hypothetical protein